MKQVALLRGINVGRAKRVAMADLRALVEELGFTEVKTVLNSGNVIYDDQGVDAAAAASRIEQALLAKTGISSKVVALTSAEIAGIVSENPFGEIADNPSCLFVTVLANPKADGEKLLPLTKRDWTPDLIAVGARAIYTWCPHGMMKSPLAETVNRLLGSGSTTRNWATVTKLHSLLK